MTNRDFRDLLAALSAHSVRFLIVGGYAVMIVNKRTVARPQDLEDVRRLERHRP